MATPPVMHPQLWTKSLSEGNYLSSSSMVAWCSMIKKVTKKRGFNYVVQWDDEDTNATRSLVLMHTTLPALPNFLVSCCGCKGDRYITRRFQVEIEGPEDPKCDAAQGIPCVLWTKEICLWYKLRKSLFSMYVLLVPTCMGAHESILGLYWSVLLWVGG